MYAILHALRAIWKERVMLNEENKQVKHGLNILRLLEAVQLPIKVAVIHCRSHPKWDAEVIKGNNKEDTTAKRVALEPLTWQLPLIPRRPDPSNYSPIYTKEELDKAQIWDFSRDLGGHVWLVNDDGQYFFPQTTACQAIREAHQGTHYRREALYNWSIEVMVIPGMKSIISGIVETHPICTINNPNIRHPHPERSPDKAHSDQMNISWGRLPE